MRGQKYCSKCSVQYFKFRQDVVSMSFGFHCVPWQMKMNAIMYFTVKKLT